MPDEDDLLAAMAAGGEATIFNMDGLMRVMGKDAKGRAAMAKMVRGAVGILGAKRLIQATMAAEEAIHEQRDDQLDALYQAVRSELAQTLAQARAWLDSQPS